MDTAGYALSDHKENEAIMREFLNSQKQKTELRTYGTLQKKLEISGSQDEF
jgi:hypothetical protein